MKLGFFVSDYNYGLAADTLERVKADGIVLVMNGVYHATVKADGKPSPLLDKAQKVYVLSEDLQTRGIPESDVNPKAKVVNMGGLVDLMFSEFEQLAWL